MRRKQEAPVPNQIKPLGLPIVDALLDGIVMNDAAQAAVIKLVETVNQLVEKANSQ